MIRLLVARHGQTSWNSEGRYTGTADLDLNETGVRQAESLADRLASHKIEAMVSSPMKRALQTAKIISRTIPCEILVIPEFAERSMGVFEGLTSDEARTRFPKLWRHAITQQMCVTPPGGETIVEVGRRVRQGLKRLAQRHRGTVILVTHAFIARMIFGILANPTDQDFFAYKLDTGDLAAYDLPIHGSI